MNKFIFSFFIVLCLLVTACGSDEPKLEFTPDYLEATTWDAELSGTAYPDPQPIRGHFVMQFYTKKSGECIPAYGESFFEGGFTYSITKDMILFNGSLTGYWTVVEHTKNKLTLQSFQPNEWIMTLTKM